MTLEVSSSNIDINITREYLFHIYHPLSVDKYCRKTDIITLT